MVAERINNDIVIGLGFGDEGKGTIVDFLATQQEPNYVVRFSGGAQAAHNVITENNVHHTFSQFGSATFRGVKTILSDQMMVNPFNMAVEANEIAEKIDRDPFELAYISSNALMITPLHVAVNHLREVARGASAHGSCGQGIGETRSYGIQHPVLGIRISDLKNPGFLFTKLNIYREWAEKQFNVKLEAPSSEELMESYLDLLDDRPFNIVSNSFIYEELRKGYNIFEGSQGILLDEKLGFHPNTTWSNTTAGNAQTLLKDSGLPKGNVIGVTRTYHTRHGYGPFPTEFDKAFDWSKKYPENHNAYGRWQGDWRVGLLDLPLLSYGIQANHGVDEIALTHTDVEVTSVVDAYVQQKSPVPVFDGDMVRQEQNITNKLLTAKTHTKTINSFEELKTIIVDDFKTPVTIESFGARSDEKKFTA